MYRVVGFLRLAVLLLGGALTACQSTPPAVPPPAACPSPPPVSCPEPIAAPTTYIPIEQRCPPIPVCRPVMKVEVTDIKSVDVHAPTNPVAEGKMLVGEVEYATIMPGKLRLEARIDSGATTSSMHATQIKTFERDGSSWVRFTTEKSDDAGRISLVTLELPRIRHVRIKSEGGDFERRPVVAVEVQIGAVKQKIEVSLTDRANYQFALLIGRNYLRDNAVIDVSRKYVQGGKSGSAKKASVEKAAADKNATDKTAIDKTAIDKNGTEKTGTEKK